MRRLLSQNHHASWPHIPIALRIIRLFANTGYHGHLVSNPDSS
jgi:hypothetical protein